VLKTESLEEKAQNELIVAFTETVNLDNNSVSPKELWNWVQKACQQCLYNSSEGLCTYKNQSLEILEIQQPQPTDKENLKWIQECHDSLGTGYPGRAKTYDLLCHGCVE
jgi:hypothetical protein